MTQRYDIVIAYHERPDCQTRKILERLDTLRERRPDINALQVDAHDPREIYNRFGMRVVPFCAFYDRETGEQKAVVFGVPRASVLEKKAQEACRIPRPH